MTVRIAGLAGVALALIITACSGGSTGTQEAATADDGAGPASGVARPMSRGALLVR